jgi:glutathione-independent formaldehyde dehydrogenase
MFDRKPKGVGGGYGNVDMGPYRDGQAEYRYSYRLLVSIVLNCPGAMEMNWMMILFSRADVFPPGYHRAEMIVVYPGSTVAVFGAEPLGMLAAYSSILPGASEVYVVDFTPERLKRSRRSERFPSISASVIR